MKKRRRPKVVKHLWLVQVRHRDYEGTRGAPRGLTRLATTGLWIICNQSPGESASIDAAMTRARRFLDRHQRQFGTPNIQKVKYRGSIDEP